MEKSKRNTIIEVIPNTGLYYDRGLREYEKGNIPRAQKYFQIGVSLAENEQDRYFGLCQVALLHQHLGNFQESLELLEELLAKGTSRYPEMYFFQANNYAFLEEYKEALKLTERYLRIEPDGEYAEEALEFKEMLEEEWYN
ncbi:hypothetical protein [Atopococcus tabaci]|uniref:hypothetical protein n=1 Tax=Atopococcus tabaci TaxID=269774 RepID=UPI00240908EB|nr:hypothetical protein [Atopococcus tabaci]